MAVKLADTLKPMGDFPAAQSSDVSIEVGGTHTQLFSIGTDGALKGASGTMKAGDYYQSVTYVTA